jgi:DNA-binding transcriptional MerR regulator
MSAQNSDFLTIKNAATLLGVSPNTLRNWGTGGKIDEYRHPVNNYRLYKRTDLQRMQKRLRMPRKAK